MQVGSLQMARHEGKYHRKDIDGLRAIAVISVVVFHFHRAAMPSGYLGVDAFFVISGFLITGIITKQVAVGAYSIGEFYARRVRRILPALMALLISCTIASSFILLPIDLVGYGRSLLSTLGFVANVYFWRDSGYFSQIAEEKPLLHMWSLGIEEQFYLIFPFVIQVLRKRPDRLKATLLAITCMSLIANVALTLLGGSLPAFYLIFTRAWEISAGGVVALVTPPNLEPKSNAFSLGVTGLILTLAGIGWPVSNMLSLLVQPVIVVTGMCLLLWSGQGNNGVRVILSSRLLVPIGVVSFSLYLWHWPIIVFVKYITVSDFSFCSMILTIVLVSIGTALSWLLENHFRQPSVPERDVYAFVGVGGVAIGLCAMLLIWTDGLPSRFPPGLARINSAVGSHYRCPVTDYIVLGSSRACSLNLPSRNPADAEVALIGNSHAQMYAPVVSEVIKQLGLHGILVNANTCWPSARMNVNAYCVDMARRYLRSVESLSLVKTVIIAFDWDPGLGQYYDADSGSFHAGLDDALIAGIDDTIDQLQAFGKRVVLVGPLMSPGWEVASIMGRSLAFHHSLERPLGVDKLSFELKFGPAIAHFEGRRDIVFLRPDTVQCDQQWCDYVKDGVPIFSDTSHLARDALPYFKPLLQGGLEQALSVPSRNPT